MLDYVNRVEATLNLTGQQRIIVEHHKHERAHWHVAWNRIDVMNEKAIQISFDREKLMMMTKEYARDHGISLPEGYYKKFEKSQEKDKDYDLGEKYQFEQTGISKEERTDIITDLWHQRDTPEAFLKSLEQNGYTLTTGNRPYVLVDIYGKLNSLPKLIADGDVRTKQIREFLGADRELPDIDDAKQAAKELLKSLSQQENQQSRDDRIEMLKRSQDERRQELNARKASLSDKQANETFKFQQDQQAKLEAQKQEYLDKKKQIKANRLEHSPTGLSAFLGKVTGVNLVTRKLHQHQDKQRHDEFMAKREELKEAQRREAEFHQRAQEMKALDKNGVKKQYSKPSIVSKTDKNTGRERL